MARREPIHLVEARLLCAATGRDELGGLIIDPEGRIQDLGPHITAGEQTLYCGGKTLIPGLIDARVHLGEPGLRHRETLAQTLYAAVRGGVTSLVALPNTLPVMDRISSFDSLQQKAQRIALARIYAQAALSRGTEGRQLSEVGLLKEAGAVGLTDGEQPVASARLMAQALSYAQAYDMPVANLCLEPELGSGDMNAGLLATRLGLSGSPSLAEELMLARDLRILRHRGGRYHASLVTTRGSVELIARYKAEGYAVTAATSVHHLLLNELAVEGYRSYAKLSPPLRSEDDRLALNQGLEEGTLDLLVSDHWPVDTDAKRLPFAEAETGMVGLEVLLPLSLLPVHNGGLSLMRWLDALTAAPAKLYGLAGGRLERGAPADLALVDLERPVRVDATRLSTPCRNLSYEGLPAQGKVLMTWVDGRAVYDASRDPLG